MSETTERTPLEQNTATISEIYDLVNELPDSPIDALLEGTLTEYTNTRITSVANYAFFCSSIKNIYTPLVTEIGHWSFQGSNVQNICAPLATYIGGQAFQSSGLQVANFPLCTDVGTSTFARCASLAEVNLPLLKAGAYYVFIGCTSLRSIKLPRMQTTGFQWFDGCTALEAADFTDATSVNKWSFANCTAFTTLILRNTSKVVKILYTGDYSPFLNTPIEAGEGYIYVPSALIEDYKVATNWTVFADQLRAIEDYPDICGGTE